MREDNYYELVATLKAYKKFTLAFCFRNDEEMRVSFTFKDKTFYFRMITVCSEPYSFYLGRTTFGSRQVWFTELQYSMIKRFLYKCYKYIHKNKKKDVDFNQLNRKGGEDA